MLPEIQKPQKPAMPKRRIDADRREPGMIRSDLVDVCKEKILESGDYAFTSNGTRIGIERKAINTDLLVSMDSGLMADELRRMIPVYDTRVLMVEGAQTFETLKRVAPRTDPMVTYMRIEHELISAQMAGIVVTRSPNDTRTADSIVRLMDYFDEGGHSSMRMIQRASVPNILFDKQFNQTITTLMTIPGISQVLAIKLLKHFKSLYKIWGAGPKELSGVPLIGPKRAQAIFEFFHREWTDAELNEV